MDDLVVPEDVAEAIRILTDATVNKPDDVGVMSGNWLGQDVFMVGVETGVGTDDHRVYPVAVMLTAEQWKQVKPPAGLGELVDDTDCQGV